jgi:hypothetical protein
MEDGMSTEPGSTEQGEKAARDLDDAAAKDEKKTEEKMGHDLAKGADRFNERSESSDESSAPIKQER